MTKHRYSIVLQIPSERQFSWFDLDIIAAHRYFCYHGIRWNCCNACLNSSVLPYVPLRAISIGSKDYLSVIKSPWAHLWRSLCLLCIMLSTCPTCLLPGNRQYSFLEFFDSGQEPKNGVLLVGRLRNIYIFLKLCPKALIFWYCKYIVFTLPSSMNNSSSLSLKSQIGLVPSIPVQNVQRIQYRIYRFTAVQ